MARSIVYDAFYSFHNGGHYFAILHDNDSAADSDPENALLPQQFNSSSLTLSASHHEGSLNQI